MHISLLFFLVMQDQPALTQGDHTRNLAVGDLKRTYLVHIPPKLEETVGKGASKVAPAVALLVEGAVVTAVIQGKPDAADVARDAALKLASDEKGV